MRNLLLLMVIATAISISTAQFSIRRNNIFTFLKQTDTVSQFEDQWFDQILDHFTADNNVTWKQRYSTNWDYYEKNGPIFLYLSGESTMQPEVLSISSLVEYAKVQKALLIQLEHRYYGKSLPFANITVENLKYLSSGQAIADAAHFIVKFNRENRIPKGTKLIAFGASYSANLAAWFRLKHPDLVSGAVASSAPVLAQVDFPGYVAVVEDSIASYSKSCVKVIETASKQISKMLCTPIGRKGLLEKFKLCEPLDDIKKFDISNFFASWTNYIFTVVQYNKDNRFDKTTANFTIDVTCDFLLNETLGTPVDRLAKFTTKLQDVFELSCLDYKYDGTIEFLKDFSNSDLAATMWLYQTCTEFGYFPTTESRPFFFYGNVLPLDYYVQTCTDVFGHKFNLDYVTSGVERTNALYLGRDIINHVTNVVFTNGIIDPWHALGITKSSNPLAPAIFLDGTAHVSEFYGSSKNDPPQLTKARQQISALINKWVNEE